MLIFSQGYFFSSYFRIYDGLGVGVLGSWIGFLRVEISVDGVWGLWCGAFGVL